MVRARAAAFAVALVAGCSHYSVSSSLPGHIRTVAIPLFANQTVEFDVKERLTDELISAFIADNTLRVVANPEEADALVEGTVVEVREDPFTFGEAEDASRFRVRVLVDVAFRDQRRNEVLWSQPRMEGWGTYDPGGGGAASASTRQEAVGAAVKMLVRAVVDKSLGGW